MLKTVLEWPFGTHARVFAPLPLVLSGARIERRADDGRKSRDFGTLAQPDGWQRWAHDLKSTPIVTRRTFSLAYRCRPIVPYAPRLAQHCGATAPPPAPAHVAPSVFACTAVSRNPQGKQPCGARGIPSISICMLSRKKYLFRCTYFWYTLKEKRGCAQCAKLFPAPHTHNQKKNVV